MRVRSQHQMAGALRLQGITMLARHSQPAFGIQIQ
jgi:hypothetical protein